MPTAATPPRLVKPPQPPRRGGLVGRLWLACLAGAIATTLALAAVAAGIAMSGAALDPMLAIESIGGACVFGLLVSMLTAGWLARSLTRPLRDIDAAITRGEAVEPARREPGEIGDVGRGVRALLVANRNLRADAAEFESLRAALDRAREAVDRWVRTERWEPIAPHAAPLGPFADALDRGMGRIAGLQDQNHEAAGLARAELLQVIDDARASAEQAEHGYVEVTSLLTTIREIARLTAEIHQVVQAPAPPPPFAPAPVPAVVPEWRDRAARAIEKLVEVSGEAVRQLGEGLLRIRGVQDQVQVMANRATLIALNSVVAASREGRATEGDAANADLKQLAREVRAATERVGALTAEIDQVVQDANGRMREVREHVLARLVELPEPPASVPAAATAPAVAPPTLLTHFVERLREMVQDAARKGERLSGSHERASSAFQRVGRRLEDEARDLEGLIARLAPTGEAQPAAGDSAADAARAHTLRLIDHAASDETPPADRNDHEETRP